MRPGKFASCCVRRFGGRTCCWYECVGTGSVVAYCVDVHGGSTSNGDESRAAFPQKLFGGIALALIALACAWTLHANLFGTHYQDALPAPAITIVTAQPAAPEAGVTNVPWTAPKKRSLLTA